MRTFLLGTYHDLPNVLLIGCIVLGAIFGSLPLLWLGLGLLLNAAVIGLAQFAAAGLAWLFPAFGASWLVRDAASMACSVVGDRTALLNVLGRGPSAAYVVPSQWMGAVAFFAVFVLYNAVRVLLHPAPTGADAQKVDNRRAVSASVILVSVAFLLLSLGRAVSGCETGLGVASALLVGGGMAMGYWHLLDVCGTGVPPDVLQVVGAMAPPPTADVTPVVCAPTAPAVPAEGFQPFRAAKAPRLVTELGKQAFQSV